MEPTQANSVPDFPPSRGVLDRALGVVEFLREHCPWDADPLGRAQRIQERVAEVGFDWPDAYGAWDKVREELAEVRAELDAARSDSLTEEIGDLLFSVVNLARLAGVHAPVALAGANTKFTRRFALLERIAHQRGMDLEEASLQELDALWEEAKEGG